MRDDAQGQHRGDGQPVKTGEGHAAEIILGSVPEPASIDIEATVIDVLVEVSRRPIQPTLESDLVADLGFDSLQILEVIGELEDRFNISIPHDEVPATRTVAQIVAEMTRLVDRAGQ